MNRRPIVSKWKEVMNDDAHWFEYEVGAFVVVFRCVGGNRLDWTCEVWRKSDRANPIGAPLFFTTPCCWEEARIDSDDFVEVFEKLVEFLPTGDRSPVIPSSRVGNKSS